MKIGLHICDFETPGGASRLGPELAALGRRADEAGLHDLSVMDHLFQIGMIGPPDQAMVEAYTALAFLAAHTTRVRLLALVTSVMYRHPGMLVKQVSTLDVLSGGRAMLGIGAAWNAEEAAGLGLPFPPLVERFERLEETLRIARQMFAGDPAPFDGKHYQLDRPLNVPAPLSRPPIIVGGGGEKKTLRLVARYADATNLFNTPDLPRKLDILREHCEREGRAYDEIEKTCTLRLDPAAGVGAAVDELHRLAGLGITVAMVMLPDLWSSSAFDTLATHILPAATPL